MAMIKKRVAKKAAAKRVAAKKAKPRKTAPKKVAKPKLLSGGNPQIAKGYGDAPVQAYIAAMPDWKRNVGRRLDALIERRPRRAQGGQVELALLWHRGPFRGTSLRPVPPGASKHKDVRYLDIHEDDELDEAQLAAWVKQASLLPGERM